MDFWASLEHKIFYKFDGEVPEHLVRELAEAAATAGEMDRRMEQLHTHTHGPVDRDNGMSGPVPEIDDALMQQLWELFPGGHNPGS
jgi:putative GTP pyrophosphokinase